MTSPINFHHLPQISLSKLYESILNSSNSKSKQGQSHSKSISQNQSSSQHSILGKAHHKDIIVQSPFYERHQDFKGPCTCAYHRMKRYRKMVELVRQEANNKMKGEIERYKERISAAVRAQNGPRCAEEEVSKKQWQRPARQTQKQNLNPQPQTHPSPKKYDLDNYNYLFQQILKKRLQPIQDHEKVSNLLKFIKITSAMDPPYLKKIRDYIFLNLMKIVSKVPFEKLISGGDDQDVLRKIGLIANVKGDRAVELLAGVRQSMGDLEAYLIQRASFKFNKEELQNSKRNALQKTLPQTTKTSQHSNPSTHKSPPNRDSSFNSEQQRDKQNNDALKKLILNGLGKGKNGGLQGNEMLSSSSRKRRGGLSCINSKRSNVERHDIDAILDIGRDNGSSGFKDESSKIKQPQDSNKKASLVKPEDLGSDQISNTSSGFKKKAHNSSTMSNKKRSSKAFEQCEANYQDAVVQGNEQGKRRKGSVRGKKRVNSKVKISVSPFSAIDYSELMSKEEFGRVKYLLGEQNNLVPDDEKIRKLLNLLQRKISQNPEFFQQFLNKFSSVLTPAQIQSLQQKHKNNEYKKMIQKLTKQVDLCLEELKHCDDLVWRQDEQEDYVVRKGIPFNRNVIQLECLNEGHGGLIEEFKKFTVVEDPPVKGKVQQEEGLGLEQKEVGELFLEEIMNIPEIKLRFFKDIARKKQAAVEEDLEWQASPINEQKHRQILRYVRKKYPSAFTEIQSNIKDTLSNSQVYLE